MRAYVVKRLLMIPITLLGVTMITFGIIKLAPGDPQAAIRGGGGEGTPREESAEIQKRWREERHLDKPVWVQYLYWVKDVFTLNLGQSFFPPREKVTDRLIDCAPVTIGLNLTAFVLIYLVAIPLGIVCGVKQFSIWDRASTVLVFILYSMPSFWIATLLILWVSKPNILASWNVVTDSESLLYGFPSRGYVGETIGEIGLRRWIWEWITHGFLPVICMTYGGFAFLSRQMRSALLENIRQDYIRTARAKGLHERAVILKHALRNSLIPIVTLFGALLPAMIAGSVIVEQIFSIPGMGNLFFDAILKRDYPIIMGELFVSAILVMVGMLISDILYVVVNPAISYD